ncbi:MAG: ribosome silencing factor [Firmicutes bacterium]|nr:ribosome silencing factor [Bacillota bacterium]
MKETDKQDKAKASKPKATTPKVTKAVKETKAKTATPKVTKPKADKVAKETKAKVVGGSKTKAAEPKEKKVSVAKPKSTEKVPKKAVSKTTKAVKKPVENQSQDWMEQFLREDIVGNLTADKEVTAPKLVLDRKPNEQEIVEIVARFLTSKKAEDVISIAVASKTTIADYFVIASSKNIVHSRSLAEGLDEVLSKEYGIEPLRRDGVSEGKWVALDYSAVIVHIFEKEMREYFKLEQLWANDNNVEQYE